MVWPLLATLGIHDSKLVTVYEPSGCRTALYVTPLVNWLLPILNVINGAGLPPVLIQLHWFVNPLITVVGPVMVGWVGLTEIYQVNFDNIKWLNDQIYDSGIVFSSR